MIVAQSSNTVAFLFSCGPFACIDLQPPFRSIQAIKYPFSISPSIYVTHCRFHKLKMANKSFKRLINFNMPLEISIRFNEARG